MSTFLVKEMKAHRLSRSRDERATGAGDQAHSEYMKALDRALQAEDDHMEFTSRKKEATKGEVEGGGQVGANDVTDKGKAMRGKA